MKFWTLYIFSHKQENIKIDLLMKLLDHLIVIMEALLILKGIVMISMTNNEFEICK